MKKLTRDRVVPIISASVSWLIFAMIGSGRPSLPKFGSRGRTSGDRRFLWGRVLDRTTAASVNSLRCDGMCDRTNIKGRHYPRDPRRASVRRVIYRAPLGSQQSCRGGPGRSIVQFERETAGTDPSASGEFWQGRSIGVNHSENQPRDTGGDDRNDAISRELFHEQISEIGSY